jgi:phage shock protein C
VRFVATSPHFIATRWSGAPMTPRVLTVHPEETAMPIPDDLERLAELHRSGALSNAEFATAKARALGGAPNPGVDGVVHWLHELRRSRTDRWLGGVCGGLAPATGLPAWLWRLIFVAFALCGGTGLMLYVLLWILVPKESAAIEPGTGSLRST